MVVIRKIMLMLVLIVPISTFADSQDDDCQIYKNKDEIVLKCADNVLFVNKDGVGVKTPSNTQFWSK